MSTFSIDAQIVSALVTAAATAALAWLTFRLVVHQRQSLEESRNARGAAVFVDIEMNHSQIKLTLGNTGHSPARNIRISVDDTLPWRKGNGLGGFSDLVLVKEGLSYLAPGRILKYIVGFVDWKDLKSGNGIARFTLTYESLPGLERHDEFVIRLSEYTGVLLESFANPSSDIANAINRLDDHMRSNRRDGISVMFKRPCPHCKELVSRSATKCPHCHEAIETESDT